MVDVGALLDPMNELETLLGLEIDAIFSSVSGFDDAGAQRWVTEAYPEVFTPYAAAASDLSVSWYNHAAPQLVFQAIPLLLPEPQSLAANVAWAFANHAATHLLRGAAQRDLWNVARQTVQENADREDGAKWARHASANACRFCQMLSTRGPVYASKQSAGRVAETAGLVSDGHKYHRNCHCMAVPVRPGGTYEPPGYVDGWTQDYFRARELAGSGDVAEIMAAYRQLDK
jgi:hypothetical protein